MNCERCLGFMILDAYSDRYETAQCPPLVWRCLNCGDIIDSQILTHRMLQKRKAVKPSPAASAWVHTHATRETGSVPDVHETARRPDIIPKADHL